MKKLLFLTILNILVLTPSKAQCAIYVCPETGAWGAMFNNGTPPMESTDGLSQLAKKECEKQGGTGCKFFYANDQAKGTWWGFIIGYNSNHSKFNYLATSNNSSKELAEQMLREKYQKEVGYPMISK